MKATPLPFRSRLDRVHDLYQRSPAQVEKMLVEAELLVLGSPNNNDSIQRRTGRRIHSASVALVS